MNNTYIMNSPYTLQEVTECALKLKVKTTPEEIFNFWESKGWKTKKGIRVQSLVVAVTVANGSINYSKNKDFYIAKERKLAKERRENVAKAIKKRKEKISKPYERYSDQLDRPEWKAFRQFIFVVRGRRCEVCGKDNIELHIHHIKYIQGRKAWEYIPDDMMVLCRGCHRLAHGIGVVE